MYEDKNDPLYLSEKERTFLKYACQELTYKQIAELMSGAERTVDGYRESAFNKLNVHSRVGLVIEAIRRKMVEIE